MILNLLNSIKIMTDLKKLNNLLELFYYQYKNQSNKNEILLTSLKNLKLKIIAGMKLFKLINQFSNEIKKFSEKGDRCLLISENRPEWFISDLSIMLSNLITVPTYTTYVEKDYEYIIDDCKPSIIIISNQEQFNKIKNIIKKKTIYKKIFSFEK